MSQQHSQQLPTDHLHVELAKKALERIIIHSSISNRFDFVVDEHTGAITVVEKQNIAVVEQTPVR
jgi:hypothetical protein